MRFDIVLWGATGFTGVLVAEYLARTVGIGGGVRWAIAGRSEAKLAVVRARLEAIDPAAKDLPVIIADAGDGESLRALARQATVVCTTVGPYALYGSDLVAACVAEGSHYCDLTGEVQWVRRMIDAHHAEAAAKRLKIVHCAGFDSIPSDLGCFRVQEVARERLGKPLSDVRSYLRRMKGGASGGTIASLSSLLAEAAGDRAVRKVLGDPYSLLPDGAVRGPDVQDVVAPRWDSDERAWVGPFLMAPTNAKIVRRSAALLGDAYGAGFRYEEMSSFGPGARGWMRANGMALGLGAIVVTMSRPVGRRALGRFLPDPGEGPDADRRAKGSFTMHVVGRGTGAQGAPTEIRVVVHGDKDPGYGSTSGMLAEVALCLALDGDTLPEHFGVVTPAAAMGRALIDRLPRAGVTFEVR